MPITAFSRVLILSLIAVATCFGQSGDIPFTRAAIASLKGKNICDLQGQFLHSFGVYLNAKKEHLVEYRERDGVIALFLSEVKSTSDDCGTVEAVLDLTDVIKPNETTEFKCYTKHEGGTTWRHWGHIVALADNHQGKVRFVKGRLAWRVNIRQKRFEPIPSARVHCDTAGYED